MINKTLEESQNLKFNEERKDELKQLRREAYQKAKLRQKLDPVFIAMKEAQKLRRREMCQQVQKRRKASEKAKKSIQKEKEVLMNAERLALKDAVLTSMIISASELESRQLHQ